MRIDGATTELIGTGLIGTGLIGREHPAAMLRAEIERAVGSHGGLTLVAGEAGIGKTTLVTSAAEEARRLGALVLSGSCWDSDSAPGYWPWVQILRGLRRCAAPGEWAAAEEAAGAELAALLGESPNADVAEGFRLYDAVTSALVAVSQSRPLVVVLEDLHWADAASLRLLEFAAQHTWFERVLMVGTYRDVEVESADHPLRPLVLPLVARATTVPLTGLEREEVAALMTRAAGRNPSADLVTEVHRRTGGNPFFVEQTARLWRSGGSVTTIAPGVRDTLLRRLSLLPAPVVDLLVTAAVLGREFHRQVLAAVAAAPVLQVERLLDQAVAARLVVARGAEAQGGETFAFAHDLVRQTLYESLDEKAASRRHAAVVEAVDRSPGLAEHVLPADVARHAYLAGDHVEPARAVDRLLAAARGAAARLAFEEALGHYRRALELAAVAGEPRRRVVIALELGRELYHGDDPDGGRRAFEEAAVVAREAGEPELVARVALSVYAACGGDGGPLGADLLREAHGELVRDGRPPDKELSLDHLARELAIHVALLARRGEDDEALAFSLWVFHDAIWGLGTAPERVALTGELLTLARRTGDVEMESIAAALRWVALLEQGDPAYLGQFREFVALGGRTDLPRIDMATASDRSIIAAFTGDFGQAETLLDELAGFEHGHDHFAYMLDHHRWAVRMLQGRDDDLDDIHRALRRSRHPCPGLLEAMTALRRGDGATALRHLRDTMARGEPRRSIQPLWLRFQAMVAAWSRDPELCEKARAELDPYLGNWAVSMYGWDIGGPVILLRALVDAAQERWDEAIDGFTAAWHSADLLHARPWSVEARAHLGEALLRRGRPGDADEAGKLLDDVEGEAGRLGMGHIVEHVRRVRLRERAPVHGRSGAEFRRDGAVWTLGFGGHTVHLPDAKGLRDLHCLLSHPGADLPAVRLLDPEGGELVVAARRMGGDAVLDEEAKTRYRRRLALLDEEIDRAAERGDDGRAAEFDRERAALLAELRSASGLGGRDRRLGDEAERARKAVTARIRDVLRKLDRLHPAMAAHLRAAVSTGATCRYQPEHEVTWRL
ncbi:AAA family ATPase [Microbispora sp. NEAU-D428]|uniref:ATP-binding protein n=1 Tax=Microbispora sitophila TaxID=2771537 RepID=UPI00186841D0|nr:AAA family ATPase [Microbispora sitophila]MBE3009033.1 AAA family ATPase [Microbispora sitophila]